MLKQFFTFTFLVAGLIATAQPQPKLFAPALPNAGAFGLAISPDSRVALWVSSNGKRDTLKIMESRQKNGVWSVPVVASFSTASGAWKDIDPVFSPDGTTVLFQSTRNTGRDTSRKDFDIWAVKLHGDGWGSAYHLGNTINTTVSESYASMSRNGNIYFMKENADGIGKSDIYVSEFKNGAYQLPLNLGAPVNTSERESNPFISPGEDYLIYFSTDPKGFGDVDLYISFKKNGQWTAGKNLGQPVNSAQAEFCPFVHKKEKRLYFSRQEKTGDLLKEGLWWVEFDVEKYRN